MNGQSSRLSRDMLLLARQLSTAARVARTVMGVPDYERYLAHVRATHPNEPPLTCDEFARARLDARYSRPGARCC
jgi:uncharacterized short protein YbdD (DUF466 family)